MIGVSVPAAAGPSAAGLSSDNISYVKTVPFDAGAASGARLYGDHLYVAGTKALTIYDVSDPLNPALQSHTPFAPKFPNEDVDTNGRILLMSDEQVGGQFQVWDVEDKTAPKPLVTVDDIRDHTFTCVLDCRWAYGALGHIFDLKDPAHPELVGMWQAPTPGFAFDTTETVPGMVLTASRTMYLLDGRKDPAHPKQVAAGGTPDHRLIHSVRWPRRGKDDFILVQGETPASVRCDEDTGAFMTWDASDWKKTHSFEMVDEFRPVNGTYVDGSPAAGALGCTTMWFDEHPTFRNGGLVASAFFEHGTRILEVSRKGKISELGYFMPFGGSTIASYWITDDIVYAIDQTRGIDILEVSN